jgi:hypothetical protein
MNVSLRFEDLFALQQILRWEFKNSLNEVTVESLKELILDSFNKAAAELKLSETPAFSDCRIEIKLLMRGTDNQALAYFDMSNLETDSSRFLFKMYADVLFPILKSGDLQPLKSIWIHEIMHLIDYGELLKNLRIFKSRMNEVSSSNFTFSYNEIRKDKHIIFLQLIMQFRAEGIATLGEYVMGGSIDYLAPPAKAAKQFEQIVSPLISLILSADLDSRRLSAYMEEISPYAYQIGAGVVLQGLIKKYPEIKEFVEIGKGLEKSLPCSISNENSLVQLVRSFDSFDFIKYSFEQDKLYHNVRVLTASYSDNLNIYEGFFVILNKIKRTRDRNRFIVLLRNLLSTAFSLEKLQEKHDQMLSNKLIPGEIIRNTALLLKELRKNPNDEVSSLALTYVFSNRDLIDDSIEYFGYIDDLEIINTALLLTRVTV